MMEEHFSSRSPPTVVHIPIISPPNVIVTQTGSSAHPPSPINVVPIRPQGPPFCARHTMGRPSLPELS
jgi:hypothetical protein